MRKTFNTIIFPPSSTPGASNMEVQEKGRVLIVGRREYTCRVTQKKPFEAPVEAP